MTVGPSMGSFERYRIERPGSRVCRRRPNDRSRIAAQDIDLDRLYSRHDHYLFPDRDARMRICTRFIAATTGAPADFLNRQNRHD